MRWDLIYILMIDFEGRFHASEKAHRLDESSSGRGVRQFKTLLLQRLQRENASSLASRVKKTDAREIQAYYKQYYELRVRIATSTASTFKIHRFLMVLQQRVPNLIGGSFFLKLLYLSLDVEVAQVFILATGIVCFVTDLFFYALLFGRERKISHDTQAADEIVFFSYSVQKSLLNSLTVMIDFEGRFHAFEKAHRLDPSSSGLALGSSRPLMRQRLERDDASSLASRVKKTDAREIQAYYKQAQLSKAYQTAGVLLDVLCVVNKTEKVEEVAPEALHRKL
ncbi:hypothetical protein K1719_043241 [Acacia pycnantha]|nr:hypothetical protein K1719_043241 [Acacia pycnantha]